MRTLPGIVMRLLGLLVSKVEDRRIVIGPAVEEDNLDALIAQM